jgi:chromate transporter
LPELESLDWRVILLSLICGVLLLRLHWGISRVLLLASAGGVLLSLLSA